MKRELTLNRRHFAAAAGLTALAGVGSARTGLRAGAPGRPEGRPEDRDVFDPIRDAVSHAGRPDADRVRDETRHPRRVLDFFGIKPGMYVADMMAGDGYYTEMVSHVVGPTGRVYCQNTKIPLERFYGPALDARLERAKLENVVRVDEDFEDVDIPAGVDAAMLVRFYHDFGWQEVDRAGFNALMYYLVKPGGVFGVVDHVGAEGSGLTGSQTLHRVEPELVRGEIESAGFVLEAESYVLRNPDDTHDWNVFTEGRRDKTDRFVYLFRKPL